jgi:hypothetical protein
MTAGLELDGAFDVRYGEEAYLGARERLAVERGVRGRGNEFSRCHHVAISSDIITTCVTAESIVTTIGEEMEQIAQGDRPKAARRSKDQRCNRRLG